MTFHIGKTKLPGILRFISDGYWFQLNRKKPVFTPYDKPQAVDREIQSMWGVSWHSGFIGLIRFGQPKNSKLDQRQIEEREAR